MNADDFEVAGAEGVETSGAEAPSAQAPTPVKEPGPALKPAPNENLVGGLPAAAISPEDLRQLQECQLAHARSIRRGQLARRHPDLADVFRANEEAEAKVAELDRQVADLTALNGTLHAQNADLSRVLDGTVAELERVRAEVEELRAKSKKAK